MPKGPIDISFLGDRELEKKLRKLGDPRTQASAARSALRDGAKVVLGESQRLVPVRTGRLKESLKVRAFSAGSRKKRGEFGREVRTGTREELGIAPDDPGYYPAAVEFGHGNVPPRSYLRAAAQNVKTEALATVRSALWRRIQQEARR